MAYNKPPVMVRKVFNPVAMRFGIGGAKTLEVPRRRSGEPQRIPVIPVEYDGARYILSTRGESDWVKNLRAAGGSARLDGKPVKATEVPVEERPPIIAAYREANGKSVEGYFKKLPDPADHPVFRLD